jgi:Carbohydrate binding module (family 6)/Secretion system C-terminal sorting domain
LRDFLPFVFQYGLNENNSNMPYKGVAHTIPGIIQAEEYDLGGNGVAYNDASTGNTGGATFRTDEDMDLENCTDIGAGYNLGFLMAGEWLEYTVNVQAAGNYDIDIRSACNGDGRLVSLSMEGVNIANNVAVANTGGWQTWVSTSLKNVPLKAGQQILRFTVGASDYVNINYIEFKNSVVTLSEDQFLEFSEVYPNPFKDHLFVDMNGSFQFQLSSSSGVVLEEGTAEGKVALGSKLPKGFYLLKIEKGTYSKLMKLVKD